SRILILLTGTDETFSQTVHSRSSYRADEVIWDARYVNIYNPPTPSGRLTVDVRKLHNVESIRKNDQHI
ncbi:MAG: ATP-sensitive inward rectifier potassium channel 10, partial [Acidobacteria bacterium]|nr:ATP-sensitive inward rectifier potassium channel 10 [Acidobacteriota bacterium]